MNPTENLSTSIDDQERKLNQPSVILETSCRFEDLPQWKKIEDGSIDMNKFNFYEEKEKNRKNPYIRKKEKDQKPRENHEIKRKGRFKQRKTRRSKL